VTVSGGVRTAAAIDVGSNSVLLLVVRVGADGAARAVDQAVVTTRLGAGLVPGGTLDPAATRRTREVVTAFAARARGAGATGVWAFATGAARRAADGGAFALETSRAAGIPVEILDGATEARLAYVGVVHGLGIGDERVLAVDVGGATTELMLGCGTPGGSSVSLPLGALSLTEAYGADRARVAGEVARMLATTDVPAMASAAGARVVASGGSATALAALMLGLARYEPRRVHGAILPVDGLEALAARAVRDGGAIDPGRAAILPAGACILAAVGHAAGTREIRVSDHGVRHAYLRERLAATGVAASMRALWS
jgi:exopolyphosphatase/guanosine-5'-triphosphate,3'-diphosphate pyrophosphatase